MAEFSKLIESIASLLWPLIVIAVILLFRPAVAAIVESARSRKFTVKIGGQELTMEEVNDQQKKLNEDLQAQIVEIRARLGTPETTPILASATSRVEASAMGVLWVDDNPKNNSYLIQLLSDRNVRVDTVLSTDDGLKLFRPGKYAYVISDMGRQEGLKYNPHAGIDLLKAIRALDRSVPVIVFCSARAAREYGAEALGEGATSVTTSTTELFGLLRLDASVH